MLRLMSASRFARAIAVSLLSLAALARAADEQKKVYTQKPEIAPAEGRPAPEPAPKPAAPTGLLTGGPNPEWIWGADENKKYIVRTTFTGGSKAARLRATCDNVMTVSLNGQKVASSSEWMAPVEVDVQKHVKDGENVLEAEISNEGGPAGFILKLGLEGADGKIRHIVTDATWKAAEKKDGEFVAARSVAKLGGGAWGETFTSGAAPDSTRPRDLFTLLPGFQVERLFTVPKEELGSWVNIVCDDKGRLIVSDQGNLGLCRITPPAIGSSEETKVERLDVKMSGVQGFLFAFDALYVVANGGPGSGLYRLKDTDGDDQFDEVTKLKDIRGGGEHGPHALRLSPDGKSIYVMSGNHTRTPFDVKLNAPVQTMGGPRAERLVAELPEGATSRIIPNWDEDLVLPRQWDGNGHATGVLAPGGWVAKTDPEGKEWEIVSIGYRNQFDFDFNADGEMFVYDADMEWDMGSPWYRPTRVSHSPSGSEFGWRSGTGKWPAYYPDSLPAIVDIGPGSPVGVDFGYGAKFPAKYQKALYICDWTFGTMYAVHITPSGASYKGVKEEFVARSPLPLTDCTVGKDGALYFTIGGRGTQSELFRVTYVGKEDTAPVDPHDAEGAELRALRQKLEAYHVADTPNKEEAAKALLAGLAHSDRYIRYAARVGLERIPTSVWQDAVLKSQDANVVIDGVVGLARAGDPALQSQTLAALDGVAYKSLSEPQRLALLRAYQLVLIRLGALSDETRAGLAKKFDSLFPAESDFENRELSQLMIACKSPGVFTKILPILTRERVVSQTDLGGLLERNKGYGGSIAAVFANQPDQMQYHYAFHLRNVKDGWSLADRKIYFGWFDTARKWSGGASYQKFLQHIEDDAWNLATDSERLAIEATGARKPYVIPELPKPSGPGQDWTLDQVISLANEKLKGRDFKNGQKIYAAARCVVCHRFGGDGGATGPDLTQLAGRFTLKDLTEAMVDPSKVISDQYKATTIETKGGQVFTGKLIADDGKAVTLVIDPEVATKTKVIPKDEIEEQLASPVSLMPKDLLKPLNENEVLDLLAYLLSRGNPQDAMFKK